MMMWRRIRLKIIIRNLTRFGSLASLWCYRAQRWDYSPIELWLSWEFICCCRTHWDPRIMFMWALVSMKLSLGCSGCSTSVTHITRTWSIRRMRSRTLISGKSCRIRDWHWSIINRTRYWRKCFKLDRWRIRQIVIYRICSRHWEFGMIPTCITMAFWIRLWPIPWLWARYRWIWLMHWRHKSGTIRASWAEWLENCLCKTRTVSWSLANTLVIWRIMNLLAI